jgi:glycerate-2-kinase
MSPPRALATELFGAALAAVDPEAILRRLFTVEGRHLLMHDPGGDAPLRLRLPLRLLGAGKAVGRMALGCHSQLAADDCGGALIVSDGNAVSIPNVEVFTAGHPLPDARGAAATQRLLELAQQRHEGDTLCLISGGASSLLVAPRPPLSLADKIATTGLLLRCGADISELNTVRKHLSQVKGGGLLRRLNCATVTLAISDVVGDSSALIGSGPTVADPSTFHDTVAVLDRYRLKESLPPTVVALVDRGCRGLEAETLKPDEPLAQGSRYRIIASNRHALIAAAAAARRHGWVTEIEPQPLLGDTTAAAQAFAQRLLSWSAQGRRVCVLAGGETTVSVRGAGRGGRNQEFALALVPLLAGARVTVLSAGTDGVDGPTDAAGAYVDGDSAARAVARGLSWQAALDANDSHSFFSELGDLLRCGPTGTNVTDIKIALIH